MTPMVRHCRAWLSLWLMTCVPFLRAKVQQKFALSWHSWERRLWKILGSKGSAKNCTSVSPPLSWGSFFLWALSQIMTFPHIYRTFVRWRLHIIPIHQQFCQKFVLFQSLMLLNSLHSATHTRPFLGICRISWTRYRAQPSPRQDSCVSQVAVGPRWGICEISWTNQSATPESSCHTSHSVSHLHFTTVDKYTWHYTFTLYNFIVLLFTTNKVRTCKMRNIPRGQTEKLISRGEVRSYLAHHHQ